MSNPFLRTSLTGFAALKSKRSLSFVGMTDQLSSLGSFSNPIFEFDFSQLSCDKLLQLIADIDNMLAIGKYTSEAYGYYQGKRMLAQQTYNSKCLTKPVDEIPPTLPPDTGNGGGGGTITNDPIINGGNANGTSTGTDNNGISNGGGGGTITNDPVINGGNANGTSTGTDNNGISNGGGAFASFGTGGEGGGGGAGTPSSTKKKFNWWWLVAIAATAFVGWQTYKLKSA